jgi:hypothetical protein
MRSTPRGKKLATSLFADINSSDAEGFSGAAKLSKSKTISHIHAKDICTSPNCKASLYSTPVRSTRSGGLSTMSTMNTTTSMKTRKSSNMIAKSPKVHKAKKYQNIDGPFKDASQYKGDFEIKEYDA